MLRVAIIIGLLGALMRLFLDIVWIADLRDVAHFLFRTSGGKVIATIPSAALVVFFVVLLVRQRKGDAK